MNNQRHIEPAYYLSGDLITFIMAFFVSAYFFNNSKVDEVDIMMFGLLLILWFIIGHWSNLYQLKIASVNTRVLNYLKSYLLLVAATLCLYLALPFAVSSHRFITAFVVAFPILGVSVHMLISNYVNFMANRKNSKSYTLVAGVGDLAENVEKQLYRNEKANYKIKGFIQCKKKEARLVPQDKVIGDLDHIHEYLKENPIDEIVIALPIKTSKKIKNILEVADYHGVRVKYVPDFQGVFGKNYKITKYGNLDVINVRQLPLDERLSFLLKNGFDKVFAALALIFLFPLFVTLAILIKLDSPGPVFYYPTRIGKGGKPFKVIKFRSMAQNDNPELGLLSTKKDDDRVTRVGRVIRKYSLDELPQFVNVLLGDMSVVGPRPHRSFLNQQFQQSEEKYMVRHYFKPGITGWAQVNGWRGPTETKEQKSQRTKHDLWYIENWSLWLDIKIIFLTIFGRKTHRNAF